MKKKTANSYAEVAKEFGVKREQVVRWRNHDCSALKHRPYDLQAVAKWLEANPQQLPKDKPKHSDQPAKKEEAPKDKPKHSDQAPKKEEAPEDKPKHSKLELLLIGIVDFVVRFFRTVGVLCFLPHRFPKKWLEHPERFVHAYTIFGFAIYSFVWLMLDLLSSDFQKKFPAADVKPFGWAQNRMVLYAVIPIILIILLSVITRRFVKVRQYEKYHILLLYSASLMCVVWIFMLLVEEGFNLLTGEMKPIPLARIGTWYSVIGPIIVVYQSLSTTGGPTDGWKPKVYSLVIAVLSICIVGVSVIGFVVYEGYQYHISHRENLPAFIEKIVMNAIEQVKNRHGSSQDSEGN